MTLQKATMATLATLGLGTLATVAALVHAGGFPALISEYTLLPLSPYAIFCGACCFIKVSKTTSIEIAIGMNRITQPLMASMALINCLASRIFCWSRFSAGSFEVTSI